MLSVFFVAPPPGGLDHCWYRGSSVHASSYICTLSVDKGGTNKAAERAYYRGGSHWTVTRVCAHPPPPSYQRWSVGEVWRGAGPGAQCSRLSVIRSGSVLLPGTVSPLPPTPGPFATDGGRLIYITESCDGAPPPPPPSAALPPQLQPS